MTQIGRSWEVTVDNLDVSGLDIEFKILRSIKPVPNKAAVIIHNLGESHRAQLMKRNRPNPAANKLVGIPVQVKAGGPDDAQLLLSADLRDVASTREGANSWKTTLAGEDGGRSYREGQISTQFSAGTPISMVLRKCCDAMGIGAGNAANFFAQAKIPGLGSTLPHTFTAHGTASAVLDRLVKSIGLTWSIQNGALQLLEKGKPLDAGAVRLAPTTGLVGSPEACIDASVSLGSPQQFAAGAKSAKAAKPKPKATGIVKFRTILIPGIVPGRKVVLESQSISGNFMVTEVEYVGQTAGNEWYCNCVGREY